MRKSLRWVAVLVALITLAGACSAKNGDDSASEDESSASEESAEKDSASDFGTLDGPCGDGDYTVDADEAGIGADKLYLAAANDRSATIRSGLNKELWDTSVAFTEWCNSVGGIGGLEIELIDMDGQLFEVESAMVNTCNDAFMMVGGGLVQDQLEFTDKPESDFHLCGMADIPGFAVSPEKADSNGQIQAIPHPSDEITASQVIALKEVHPEAAEKMAEVWGDLPSMEAIKNQSVAIMEEQGIENVGVFSYPITGLEDWTPLAQQIISSDAGSFHFVGEPTNLGNLVSKLREQGWEGVPVVETNSYDPVYLESTTPSSAAEGSFIRSVFHPFEEASQWPAVQQYLDLLEEAVPEHKERALLGLQGFSAWLLFAEAANDCAAGNDNELTRDCVLFAADDINAWTGGGLHSEMDPGGVGATPPACELQLGVVDGEFVRVFPELGSDDDDGDGFNCPDDAEVSVPANEGLGVVDPDRAI